MRVDILTLFPEAVRAMLASSILGRARENGLISIHYHQIRDHTLNKQKQVDDYPYGGGPGMILMASPLARCLRHVQDVAGRGHVILLSAQGFVFSQNKARELVERPHLILVCGHYEGVDERFIEAAVDEEISIGDYVLTGGEIPAMVVCDCVCRLVPGVLSEEAGFIGESHWDGRLEYPQYTRPTVWEGRPVPDVLLSGNARDIERWRKAQSEARTKARRPDLWNKQTP